MIVGGGLFGEDLFEHELHELADARGLGDRVEFRELQEDVWPELARMDMLVHASMIPEPFGQVVLEAMAARLAVIAADAGASGEIIRHDVNGILYPMRDRVGLARALCELAADPERRRRLGMRPWRPPPHTTPTAWPSACNACTATS